MSGFSFHQNLKKKIFSGWAPGAPPGPPWGWGPREKFSGVTPCERPWVCLIELMKYRVVNEKCLEFHTFL